MASYIDDKGVKQLKEKPRYKSQDESIASKCLQPFWQIVVGFMPNWVAPNVITLAGFAGMITSYAVSSHYCPSFTEIVPPWVHLLCGFCLFWYQTMDAIDGMQARRTGAGSVVGEFLDNFIDIPSMMLGLLAVCVSLRFYGLPLVFVCLSLIAVHYSILWETHHTKVMAFGVGSNAVTEGQLVLIGLHLVTFIVGPHIWDIDVLKLLGVSVGKQYLDWLGGTLSLNIVVVGVAAGVLNVIGTISAIGRVLKMEKDPMAGEKIVKSTSLLQLLPMFITIGGLYYITIASSSNILKNDTRLLMALIIFIECMLLGTMVIHRMCSAPLRPLPIYLWPLIAICINNWVARSRNQPPTVFGFTENQMIFGYTVLLAVMSLHLAGNVIYTMCNQLGVSFLTIQKNSAYILKNQTPKKGN